MGAVASCVVEFWVRRDLAAQWKDVADHMQYLGVHMPELRNGKVMATWSAKFFSKDRKPAPHDKATYLHGFFRLPMTVVDPGIFLTRKETTSPSFPSLLPPWMMPLLKQPVTPTSLVSLSTRSILLSVAGVRTFRRFAKSSPPKACSSQKVRCRRTRRPSISSTLPITQPRKR